MLQDNSALDVVALKHTAQDHGQYQGTEWNVPAFEKEADNTEYDRKCDVCIVVSGGESTRNTENDDESIEGFALQTQDMRGHIVDENMHDRQEQDACEEETIFYKGIMPSEKVLDLPVDCNTLAGSVNL